MQGAFHTRQIFALSSRRFDLPTHLITPPYRVKGVGCRVQGVGCRVQGVGCRVQGVGCKVQGASVSLMPQQPPTLRVIDSEGCTPIVCAGRGAEGAEAPPPPHSTPTP